MEAKTASASARKSGSFSRGDAAMPCQGKPDGKARHLVLSGCVQSRQQYLFAAAVVLLLCHLLGQVIRERVGVEVDDGAKQYPKLCRAEAGRGVLEDAVVGGFAGLAQFMPPGLFRLVLLLLPFHLLPPFLGLALLLGLVLLAALFVFGPALLGLFVPSRLPGRVA